MFFQDVLRFLYSIGVHEVKLFLEGGDSMESDKLYSVPAAAKWLGDISPWTVHAWLSQGKLRRTKVGRRTMIRESESRHVIEDEPVRPRARKSV